MKNTYPIKLGVIMDPIEHIRPENDTTVHLLDAAQRYGFSISYLPYKNLYVTHGEAFGLARHIKVFKDNTPWYQEGNIQENIPLSHFDILLMRKDPPFTLAYIYMTYMLELAEKKGVLVVNKPQSLRDANEKLFASHFPQCCPPTLISQDKTMLYHFWKREKNVVFKPLDGMAGQSIFVAHENELNVNVIIEMLTKDGTLPILVQRYLPEIHTTGDKRILLVDGEPIPLAVARFPAQHETRANLAVGGNGVVVPLTDRDYWLCEQIAPTLKEKQLLFVGIDVIGDYITEINVTSPTGLPLITRMQFSMGFETDIVGQFIKTLMQKREAKLK